ncbi:Shikimate kinase 2 [Lignipirellula cremea]|uniref:Shikimate kinase n=1 Tax=Lignipirellula cremea TaxID=2528010 RepID=A0A518E110_9BACT|nr:Shikimate kinase 2 [Lignipirellula cremea]
MLIGYRGSGKTSVARPLAEKLGAPWFDADQELQRTAGKTIAQIFADDGEPAFRHLEEAAITRLLQHDPPLVLALGGGAVMRESTRQRLREAALVVWLKASAGRLYERITADAATQANRPPLTAHGGLAEIEQLLAQREPIYQAVSHFAVDAEDRTPSEIADAIFARLPAAAGESRQP